MVFWRNCDLDVEICNDSEIMNNLATGCGTQVLQVLYTGLYIQFELRLVPSLNVIHESIMVLVLTLLH
jgi:hypothetical protein